MTEDTWADWQLWSIQNHWAAAYNIRSLLGGSQKGRYGLPAFPDFDNPPFGWLTDPYQGRVPHFMSPLTPTEQYTVATFWMFCRAPMFYEGVRTYPIHIYVPVTRSEETDMRWKCYDGTLHSCSIGLRSHSCQLSPFSLSYCLFMCTGLGQLPLRRQQPHQSYSSSCTNSLHIAPSCVDCVTDVMMFGLCWDVLLNCVAHP